jgi:digeranylgeranylglycerophospholipid reductase
MGKKRVCVIGAGPAGLAAAVEGVRLGLEIDLFERSEIGKHISCAEGFYDSMHLVGKPRIGVRYKVDEALLKVEKEYRIDCRKINLWMIDREEWQKDFAAQAKAAGARIFEKTRITSDLLLTLESEYDWIIDASGVPSITSVRYGFRDYYKRNGAVTVQYVLNGDFSAQGERLKFLAFPHYKGYFWVFPKSSTTANVGFGYFDPECKERDFSGKQLWARLDQLMAQERVTGQIIKRTGGVVPIRLREQLQYGKVLLVGDAAGCASPLHGGGIDTALITGREAVRWIAGNEEPENSFSKIIWRILSPKLEVERRVCQIWKGLDLGGVDTAAALLAQRYLDIGLTNFIRCFPRLLPEFRTGLSLRRGLMTGKWTN